MNSEPRVSEGDSTGAGRRDLIWSILVAIGVLLALLLATDAGSIIRLKRLLGSFRSSDIDLSMPTWAYIWAALKILSFYVLFGIALGYVLRLLAIGLASSKGDDGKWAVPRRGYYRAYLALLAGVVVYIHVHAGLVYPALFISSWRWAALAGSPTVVMLVGLLGKIGMALIVLIALRKRWESIAAWLRRRWWAVAAVALLIGAGYGASKWQSRPRSGNMGPNIILIGLDSVRPDHVSGLGYAKKTGRKTTPNVDAFMKDAVTFSNAHVPIARTGPSWVSVLTGCYPIRTNHRCDLVPKETQTPPVKSVASHLKEMDYKTAFFLDNTNYMRMEPELGFDHIVQPDPNVIWFTLSQFDIHLVTYYYCLNNPLGFYYAPMLRANQAFSAIYEWRYFAKEIERYLARLRGEKKFFLAAHSCIVHAPFGVRYPYSTYFAPPKDLPMPTNRFTFRWPVEQMMTARDYLEKRNRSMKGPIFSQEINLYDALVRQTDDWFGDVMKSIREMGLYDNSLIVVFSDHGEDLFREDYPYRYLTSNHGFHVWGNDGTHVLMAIKFPKGKYAGRTVPWLVRSIDIVPTVLEALTLPPLPKTDGVSLMPQIENPALDPHLTAYAEPGLSLEQWFVPNHRAYPFEHFLRFQYVDREDMRVYRKQEYMPGFVMAKDRALRDERWKIVAYPMEGDPVPFKTSLHELENDPTNVIDLSTTAPLVLEEMRRRLAPFIEQDAETYGFKWEWSNERIRPAPDPM